MAHPYALLEHRFSFPGMCLPMPQLRREALEGANVDLKQVGPRWIVPTHCTGFAGVHLFAQEMPGAFIQNGVGTTIVLQAAAG